MEHTLAGKRVLVTGGTGLVGSQLCESLSELGSAVFVTYRSTIPQSYFVEQKLGSKVTGLICDITDHHRVFEIVTRYEVEYIFHIAAQAIVAHAYHNPYQTFNTNIMGTVNVLEAARKSPLIKGVLVASSDKAYGKNCLNVTEDQPLTGDHPYDVSKSATDLIAQTYFKTYGLPVSISRFGNIFGPGDLNFNRIIPGAMRAVLKNETLFIRSDGKFIRDYVFVKDVVAGYIAMAEQIEVARGQAFNFSTGYNFSVLDLLKKISEVIGKPIPYEIQNNQQNEIPAQSLNFKKAQQVLGWKSQYSLEDGIRQTYNWYQNFFK